MSQIGTDGDDRIDAAQSVVYGLEGNDRIFTVIGSPQIYGGGGNDFIANNSNTTMYGYGGSGNDTIHGDATADRLTGDDGNDLLVGGMFDYNYADVNDGIIQFDIVTGSDVLYGGDGVDGLYGLDADDVLFGGDGDDTNGLTVIAPRDLAGGSWLIKAGLYGGLGADYLDGGRGQDYLDGGEGADTLIGGEGNDKLYGGGGNDTIWADQGTDVAYGGSGNDTIYSGLGNTISALGEAGNDTIATGNGNDYIDGGADNDTIFSGGGNDTVLGGNGSDALGGYLGNDTFYGDYNVGGLDYFNLSFDVRAGDADYIADFKAGGVQDYIILPSAYSGSVYLTQYGTDVIGYIAQGSSYYSFQVHSANPLTIAEVQAGLFFA
ncbi:calcium-binding protein [Bosea sp. (in: a-proteobacteria)]|jgi:Ca2+-binding RTX toxin-like protein|uniref:calcium-binding protein n=1 Tax=Bosea sp. (in: a-proteobacteria) TaxID=1871050 RepID=UPI003F6EF883